MWLTKRANPKIRFVIFISICCLFTFTSCEKRNPIQGNCEIDNTNIKEIYWEENVIKVKGAGVCPVCPECTELQLRLLARRAAIEECRYEVIFQNKLNGEGGLSEIVGQEIIEKCY